jgi:Multicopper oxidase
MKSIFSGLLVLLAFLLSFVDAETKHYALVVTEEVIYPDCTPRLSLVVNGTFPGPALYATAGDHIFIRYAFGLLFDSWQGLQRGNERQFDHALAWYQPVRLAVCRRDTVRESMAHSSRQVL